MDYNATKGGVGTVYVMCTICSTSIIARRWPSVIFHGFLDVAGINSKIFRANIPNLKIVEEHLDSTALSLMKENLKRRATLTNLPRAIKVFLRKVQGSTKSSISYSFHGKEYLMFLR
ncbi:hypothetical protein HHI36_010090 [Cryptolaemus montrouzieri]|uniref:Uncharacterized protein n=1 Tax=Cryptolaemus montrouzieri TaxID=559131 RepID=A0ABD2MHW2_9CUCU